MRIYGPLIHSLVTVGRLGSEIMASFASSRSGRPHYEDRDLVWGTPHITVNPPPNSRPNNDNNNNHRRIETKGNKETILAVDLATVHFPISLVVIRI